MVFCADTRGEHSSRVYPSFVSLLSKLSPSRVSPFRLDLKRRGRNLRRLRCDRSFYPQARECASNDAAWEVEKLKTNQTVSAHVSSKKTHPRRKTPSRITRRKSNSQLEPAVTSLPPPLLSPLHSHPRVDPRSHVPIPRTASLPRRILRDGSSSDYPPVCERCAATALCTRI